MNQESSTFVGVNPTKLILFRNWTLVGISFLIPLEPKLVTGPIILMVLSSLFLYKEWQMETFKSFPKSVKWGLYAMVGLFFYHIIGLIWSTDVEGGITDVLQKLNLLILPIFLCLMTMEEKTIIRILKAFIIGVFLSVILNLLNSYMIYVENHELYVFTGEYAIRNVHLGYYAIYLLFSMSLIVDFFLSGWLKTSKGSKWIYIFIGISSIPILVLSGSKMGFFILTGLIFFLIFFILKGKDWKKVLLIPLIAMISLGLAVSQTQHLKDRLNTMYERTFHSPILPESVESTMARRMTWMSTTIVWSKSPLLGTGTGDIQNELTETYKEQGFTGPLSRGLDPHSQYLQTAAALGLLGIVLLLGAILLPLKHALRKGQFSIIAFFLIILLANVTESALERQAGLQFFAFFSPILLLWSMKTENSSQFKQDLINLWPFK